MNDDLNKSAQRTEYQRLDMSAFSEIQRQVNLEDKHNPLLNLFFCFYCPFVCRCHPIQDSDIYVVGKKDRTDVVTVKATEQWNIGYLKYQEQIAQLKNNGPNPIGNNGSRSKKIPHPSIIKIIFKTLGGLQLFLSVLLWLVSYAFMFIQPYMMKQILHVLEQKQAHPLTKFPWMWGSLLIVSPFAEELSDAWGIRHFYHFSHRARAMLSGMIFNKSLKLKISSRSAVDEGRMLSLMSADVVQVAEELWMPMLLLVSPLVFFVPLVLLSLEFGITSLVSIGVIVASLLFQYPLSRLMTSALTTYLQHNDTRNKITKHVVQDMRVVKMSGLEKVMSDRVSLSRELQLQSTFKYILAFQLVSSLVHVLPDLVNAVTITTFVYHQKLTQAQFATKVMPCVGYLTMMTRETHLFPEYIQCLIMMNVSQKRIRQFLLLDETDGLKREELGDREDIIVVKDGEFQWESVGDLPLTDEEEEEQRKAERKAIKEEKKNSRIIDRALRKMNKHADQTPTEKTRLLAPSHAPYNSAQPASSPPLPAGTLNINSTDTDSDQGSIISFLPANSPSPNRGHLTGINLTIKKGEFVMIVGSVGSGKTSLGAALKGDMECVGGTHSLRGTVAYCSQLPWITNDTVQNNILFGQPMDEEKYRKVVEVCQLETDFSLFSAGDRTVIGEKGVTLSGGQKARIQLARAVYSDRDVYILDDPLSAVDAHVGKALMKKCLCEELKGKTIVLITNQIQHLHKADKVVMVENGTIGFQGTPEEMVQSGILEVDDTGTYKTLATLTDKLPFTEAKPEDEEKKDGPEKLMTEEEYQTGHVPLRNYLLYVKTLFPLPLAVVFLLILAVSEGGLVFASYWMGVVGNEDQFAALSFHTKLHILSFIPVAALLLLLLRSVLSAFGVRHSSRKLHADLVAHVFGCPTSFFDTTPLGRILNRFSGDIVQTDQQLFNQFLQVACFWMEFVGQVVIVGVDTLWFIPVGLAALLAYFVLLFFYSRSARNILRLTSISRSPVLSVFTETVSLGGIAAIRGYEVEELWRQKFNECNDRWTIRSLLFEEGSLWAALWSSVISSLYLLGVVVIGWFFMDPSKLGVAITSSLTFTYLGGQIVRENVELDSRMTSFERIRFYSTQLPQEVKTGTVDPPPNWPSEGKIQFDHVTMKYRPKMSNVLNDISFVVQPGEKVGICGRTGAGKSSLVYPLFRLVELEKSLMPKSIDLETGFPVELMEEDFNSGRVVVDGVDISTVALDRVRRSIEIISQDPILFEGNVRSNVDVFGGKSDEQIWDALKQVELDQEFGEFGLDTPVSESGWNLSAGQRQLICFGRVLLNDTKIVVLDEATASVDLETDEMIQRVLRENMKGRTLLVIAHRLNTIIDADRILVLDKGRAAEFDAPDVLTRIPQSLFSKLLRNSS
ncbi:Multidrug resistance-associated protein [Blattamonas nauphoetae]|uniref:Multidrug resistance-associated protein n=1 Tax=Blattamonas nauphoetae TaxID=2049346 RepID=A0ABQ9YJK1_9EUKA|nr:Multidrug resistance-associated protein [Blattamonas nauphoetae]